MSYGELTSNEVAALASKALQHPSSLTDIEKKQLAGSVLTQTPNKPGGPAPGEETSPEVASIASKGLHSPWSLTIEEIKKLAGSALTQARNRR